MAQTPVKRKVNVHPKKTASSARTSTKKPNTSHKKFRWGRLFKWIAIPILTVGLIAFIAAALLFVSYAASSPKLDISKLESQPNTTILDKNDKVVASLGAQQRVLVSTDQVPMTMVNAITSIEDHNFFYEKGVDPQRIISSVIHNSTSDTTQGGSTITQQLIKLSFFSTAESDATLKRKAQEAWMAINLEKEMSKEQILTLYLNKVYVGNGNYGMQTAAENYFGKPLSQIDLAQTAMLAGMVNAPYTYDPYTNPTLTKERRDLVLQAMYKYGKITQAQETKAIAEPLTTGLLPHKTTTQGIPQDLQNYVTEVVAQIEKETGKNPTTTSMKIYTPLDSAAQQQLFNVINNEVPLPDDKFQIASTIVNVKTGAVIAQLGGRHQPNVSFGFNQAVSTDRDFGSAMKPLTDYGPAFQYGIYKSTADHVEDTPYNYPDTSTAVNDWDNSYYGTMTIRAALAESRNIPAVRTLQAVGLTNSSKFLASVGIQYYPSEVYANAISSNSNSTDAKYGASTEKMAAAYAAFSNGGYYTSPYYVNKIVFADGSSKDLTNSSKQVMSADTAYIITDILKSVLLGNVPNPLPTGPQAANVSGVPLAAKTGTSNYTDDQYAQAMANAAGINLEGFGINPDENIVGYSTDYSMAVWTGYTNRMQPVAGMDEQYAAGRTFHDMMSYFYPNSTNTDWTMPSDLKRYNGELYMPGAVIYTPPVSSSSKEIASSSAPASSAAPAPSSSAKQ
ncbi:MAG: penicillin-binding protein [Streptococcaceae bacterium]|jgi:penicillin-binding protein 1A|nr:penicillin-binding protein [Streptococcaceae bacterium]